MELISVVVITYNSASTVVETLESIRAQTYPNLEIVVADDCSKDNTVEVVNAWFKNTQFPGVVVANKVNKGVPSNLNSGIKASSGNLIKYFAGDDIMNANALSEYYHAFKMDSDVIWQARCKCFGVDAQHIELVENSLPDYDFFNWDNKKQYKALCVYNRIAAPALGILKREWLERNGLFDENFNMLEDYPFVLKASKMGVCFRLIDQYLVNYRISEKSVTGAASKKYYKCMQKLFFRMRFMQMIKTGSLVDALKQCGRYVLIYFNIAIINQDKTRRFVLIK